MSVMDTALRESLKSLRLSGMLETLDARLAQAHGGELGHLDFLQVLCQDEITRRETVAFQRRLQRAKFEQQVTLEEFDFTASSKLPAAQIRDLGALRWLHAGESVILFGPVGVGKTHIAQALGHLAVRQGAHVRFAKTSRILAELAGGHADRTWEKRIRELVRPDVLILDDFAMRQLSAAHADDLYELVSERQGRSLIITSNRAPSDWYPLFPNPVVAESLLDRLINTSHQVIMNGPSYPSEQAPQEPHRQARQAVGPLTPGPFHVPFPRQFLVTEDTDEVLLPNDVQLTAGETAPEHHLVGEAGRMIDPGCVQSLRDSRPRADVRAVSGRLVTHLTDHPLPGLLAEAHLAGTQNGATASTHHVLAPARRQPQHTRRVDDERERLGQLYRCQIRSPVVEVRRRVDASALSLWPNKGPQIRRSHIPIAPPQQVHAGQRYALARPGPGELRELTPGE
ncbi:DNA replication protein DnaC [Streptomyces sp. OK228]|nr:IS21-like element helper ATPase IstB [Streptomyces sp. OK228]SOE24834.1 DNA replication protein DnaC [Streptomyces sp. OK228]